MRVVPPTLNERLKHNSGCPAQRGESEGPVNMSLTYPTVSPFDQICVALDLETTGLDSDRDTIIEVGAVKFQGDLVIDTFQSFVNPGRPIPEFIQRLTGITPSKVKRAPFFASISEELRDFLELYPVVGHNVNFDLGFLASHGLSLDNPAYDTWDLASFLLPRTMQYSLGHLASHFRIEHTTPHLAGWESPRSGARPTASPLWTKQNS